MKGNLGDINAGLKLLGSAYFLKHEVLLAQVASSPLVVFEKAGKPFRLTCRV